MADQKLMKKRLKALMQRPENQVCSDCPEKKPTWASLIVPPPDAPPGTEKIGAFCCLECSGSHRRLGVHISFVRSVNLDAWKEWEVRAMENGGNAKVNAIFEARLVQSGKIKPTNLADGPTRERYIRDKYERRKYYDPAGFSADYSSVVHPLSADDASAATSGPRPGAPSEIARQRVASRQARMKPAQSNLYDSQPARPAAAAVAQAPVSAPVDFDLLDFSSDTPPVSTPSFGGSDPFLTAQAPQSIASTAGSTSSLCPVPQTRETTQGAAVSLSLGPKPAQEMMKNPTPEVDKPTSTEAIMALFGPSQQQQQQQQQSGYGMQAMAGMMPGTSHNMMMGGMVPQQIGQNVHGMNSFGGAGMMNGTQFSGNAGFMASNLVGNNNNMTQQHQQQMMMGGCNQMMMNPQMQQQMMTMHQNQFQMQTQMGMNTNIAMPINIGNNSTNFNAVMQGMQNMQVGPNFGINRQPSEDGGFGAPMGGSSQHQNSKSDPFSSLGGMNTFR
ncbi:putative GTPase activating protein [Nitzschia inconspicua]|uniref:GTPase activating protein n=1 Tax=Nitzschia inconspicua TaxID=303405 RepID=A0A9K3LQ34_9STRA|nr:putative GTPase activating protein [Nitzschia inconspicua]